MAAGGIPAVRVAIISDHPMLMQPLARWLARDGQLDSIFIDIRAAACTLSCRRHGADVIVVDHASANGSLLHLVEDLLHQLPAAKVLLLSPRTDAHTMRIAADAGCAGLIATDQPPESLMSAVMAAHGAPIPEPASVAPELKRLTSREDAVLHMLADGLSTAELAKALQISQNTARAHIQHVIEKLGAHSKLEAVAIARRAALV